MVADYCTLSMPHYSMTEVMDLSRVIDNYARGHKMAVMGFPEFLEQKYVDWLHRNGKRKSLEEFASYLGVSQPLISHWLSGHRRPGPANIKMLAEVFGPEVYDSLGLQRPNPLQAYAARNWDRLPPKEQRKISEII